MSTNINHNDVKEMISQAISDSEDREQATDIAFIQLCLFLSRLEQEKPLRQADLKESNQPIAV